MTRHLNLIAICALLTLAIGCGGSGVQHGAATPEAAVNGNMSALRSGDLKTLLAVSLKPDAYEKMRSDWNAQRVQPMSDQEKAQGNMVLAMLTAEGAEAKLYDMMQPKLAEAQGMVPMVAGAMAMGMQKALQQGAMTDEEQKQFQEFAQALSEWAGKLQLDDEAKAKQVIGIVCTAARKLGIKDVTEVQSMSFETLLDKGGIAMLAALDVFEVYGLDLKTGLSTAKVGKVTVEGSTATVPTTITLLGKTFTGKAKLVQVDGRWYAEKQPE